MEPSVYSLFVAKNNAVLVKINVQRVTLVLLPARILARGVQTPAFIRVPSPPPIIPLIFLKTPIRFSFSLRKPFYLPKFKED